MTIGFYNVDSEMLKLQNKLNCYLKKIDINQAQIKNESQVFFFFQIIYLLKAIVTVKLLYQVFSLICFHFYTKHLSN